MLLAEDDQYKQLVNVLEKNFKNHRFYRSQERLSNFSESQISLEEVADFLGDLTGLSVTTEQVKQLLQGAGYDNNHYSEKEVIAQLSSQFENIKGKESTKI